MNPTNVHPFPGSRPAESPSRSDPVAMLIAAIDQATGGKWSFDIVSHHVVESTGETIVLAKLLVDGKYRVAFGGTSEKGTLVARLNAATLDALTRAAAWMGIEVEAQAGGRQETAPATEAEAGSRITRKQLDFATRLAGERGISRDKLAAGCLAEFRKKPEYLTRAEASRLIESLKEGQP